jgi:hypothetical protein
VSLLAAETKLIVLLLALSSRSSSFAFAAIGFRVVRLEANVEEVFLVGLGDVCALAF